MDAPLHRPAVSSGIYCRDPWAELDWLEKAFGFERTLVVTNPDGSLGHAEMRFGDGVIHIGSQWAEFIASPAEVGNKNTQTIHIQLQRDIDAHCAHARAAGATILQEPADEFYGDRTYRARDPEGHVWTFGQTVRQVSLPEMERASGLKIEAKQRS